MTKSDNIGLFCHVLVFQGTSGLLFFTTTHPFSLSLCSLDEEIIQKTQLKLPTSRQNVNVKLAIFLILTDELCGLSLKR